jgi:D-alanyl-lipoteichoic acid acyltransferase DltB (MBOAT superfamily)
MITMLLGGLWHGAAWHFVFWGAYHGVLLAAHHYIADLRVAIDRPPPPDTRWRIARQRTITFGLVCVGWVFFRSDSMATAFAMLGRLVTGWSTPSELVTPLVVITVAAMIALQYAPHQQALRLQDRISRMHPVALGAAMGVVLMVIAVLGPQGVAPFIYFQF